MTWQATRTPSAWRISAAAVLFDMDGTLVDSTAVVESQWEQFATKYQLELAPIIEFSHGRQTIDTVARFLPAGLDVAAVTAEFEAAELDELAGIIEIPGAAELLTALPEGKVAMVTSAPRELAVRRTRISGIPVPAVVIGAEDVHIGKPDPEGYLAAAAELGVPASQCVAFEDAAAGLRSATASGAPTVVVGEHESAVSAGLARVVDLREVSVEVIDQRVILRGGHVGEEAWPWQPVLAGERLVARPLLESDFATLTEVAADPEIWAQHPNSDRWQPAVIGRFLAKALACRGGLTICDRASGQIIGCTRYYDHLPGRHVFIGYTYLARSHWGGQTNRELKALLVEHALQFVPAIRLSIGAGNRRSQIATERLGARYIGEVASADARFPDNRLYVLDRIPPAQAGVERGSPEPHSKPPES
ncbi:MAG: HAD-IA family hydrolase [Candidatus Nanopelagicales bacterium]